MVKDLAEEEVLSFGLVTWPHVITRSEVHLTLRVSFSHHKSPPCQVLFCRRGDILFLFCHVTSCNHVVRGSCDIMVEFSSLQVTILQSWWSQALFKGKYFVFILSCDLTWLSGQKVTWHYRWSYLVISDYPAKFRDHRPFGRGDIKLSVCHMTCMAT